MDFITAGIAAVGSASNVAGSLFGSQNNANTQLGWLNIANGMADIQQNKLRQRQMNLDATRRKRDIIRQAQVATANAEAMASSSGALTSSGIEGARAGISGQEGVNYLGVSQNQEIGNKMFKMENMRVQQGMIAGFQKMSQRTNMWDIIGSIGSGVASGNNPEMLSKVGQWGYGVISGL